MAGECAGVLCIEEPQVKHVSFSAASSERNKLPCIATDKGIENLGSSPQRSILSPKFRRKAMDKSPAAQEVIDPDDLERMWRDFKSSSKNGGSSGIFGVKPKEENGESGLFGAIPTRKKRHHKLDSNNFTFPDTQSFDVLEKMLHGCPSSHPPQRARTSSESDGVDTWVKRVLGDQEEQFQPDWLTSDFVVNQSQLSPSSKNSQTNHMNTSITMARSQQQPDRSVRDSNIQTGLSKEGDPGKESRGRERSRSTSARNSGTKATRGRSRSCVPVTRPARDDTDFARPVGVPKSSTSRRVAPSSASSGKRPSVGAKSGSSSASATPKMKRSGTAAAGALDEDSFIRLFEDVPKVHLFSNRELSDKMTRIKDCLLDSNTQWEKRVEALKEIRSLVISGGTEYEDFYQLLRQLEPSIQFSAKDLRSQVVREACISVAYLSQTLQSKFDHFAEAIMPNMIALIPNSAKVMASSAVVCVRFILSNTHAPRLIPIITGHLTSKNSIIRRQCLEFLEMILLTWQTHSLERHIAILQEALKRGLGDADSEARTTARKAFWGFSEHFKDQADSLLQSLDPSKQKLLHGGLSSSSSSNSLNNVGARATASRVSSGISSAPKDKGPRSRSMSTERASNALYSRTLSGRSNYSKTPSAVSTDQTDKAMARSNSAVDLAGNPTSTSSSTSSAGRRPHGSTSGDYNSLPRPKKSPSASSAERSRTRSRVGISQSQPGSRSGSPSSRLTYGQQTAQHVPQRRRSGIPRSQGASREASPSRMHTSSYGSERKLNNRGTQRVPVKGTRVLTPGKDAEAALADALLTKQNMRRRYESYDSDGGDAGSETSSVCSERSFSSYGGRTSEDVAEILANLSSGSWADRKDGLISLQAMLRSGAPCLNRLELKKVTEVFTRMFHDPHGKVFSLFLETLVDLMGVHSQELHDWLYICLTRLINKMGSDMLGSVQAKVQRALEVVRESFAMDHQFSIVCRFIVDQTQTPNLKVKVKVALMNYLHGLSLSMDASDFQNMSDTRLAVSRIITWTTEPKSVEVRKAAQAVLIALFNLNTPEFSMMLNVLPKTFQDGATKILHNHLRGASSAASPHSSSSVESLELPLTPRNNSLGGHGSHSKKYSHRPSPSSIRVDSEDADDVENMNPEDINNSIKQMSADIQSLSKMPDFDGAPPNSSSSSSHKTQQQRMGQESSSQDSGIHDQNLSKHLVMARALYDVDGLDLFNEGDDMNGAAAAGDRAELISEILSELSNHNERVEERKNAMIELIRITRTEQQMHAAEEADIWDEHFKTILLLLLETLGDQDGQIRALALRVLREILRCQPIRFQEYAELTILKVLEAHKDPVRDVMRSAEECASSVANAIHPENCIRVLTQIISTADYPVNLAAIKMQTKVIEASSSSSSGRVAGRVGEGEAAGGGGGGLCLQPLLPQIMPGLLKAYDNSESSVRKASVFCMVATHLMVGEALMRPFLSELTGSKMKLLNLYIKRAQSDSNAAAAGGGSSCSIASSSKTASPSASSATITGDRDLFN